MLLADPQASVNSLMFLFVILLAHIMPCTVKLLLLLLLLKIKFQGLAGMQVNK